MKTKMLVRIPVSLLNSPSSFSISLTITLWLLAGCTQLATRPNSPKPLTLTYTNHRYLTLEPCGCSMNPIGGIKRELRWKKAWQKKFPNTDWLSLSSGTSFFPQNPPPVQKTQAEQWEKKVRFVQALNEVGLSALAPSLDDFRDGIEPLMKLQKLATFPFLSANVQLRETGRSALAPYARISVAGTEFYLIGLSSPDGNFALPQDLQVIPWQTALHQTIAKIPRKNRVLVVLHTLGETERNELIERFPEVNIVLGDYGHSFHQSQSRGRTLSAGARNSGQEIAALFFPQSRFGFPFYNQTQAQVISEARPFWRRSLATSSDSSQTYANFLELTKDIPLRKTGKTNPVEFFKVLLDKSFDAPQTTRPVSADLAP